MISNRSVVVIVAAAALGAAAAWWATSLRAPSTGLSDKGRAALLPELGELATSGDSIDRVEIRRGDQRLEVARAGDGWVAVDHADYPIDGARLESILAALARLERDQAMTALPARHAELGLAWPDDSGEATLVRLLDGDATVTEVVLGRTRFTPPTVYARRLHEDQTWRCLGEVTLDANPIRMMNPVVLELPGEAIRLIERHAEGTDARAMALVRDDAGTWVIEEAGDAAPGNVDEEGSALADRDDSPHRDEGQTEDEPGAEPALLQDGPDDRARAEVLRVLPELFTRLEFDAVRRATDSPVAPEHRVTAQVGDRAVVVEILPAESAAEGAAPFAEPGRWFRVFVGAAEPWLGALTPSDATLAALDAAASRSAGREFRLPSWRSSRVMSVLERPAAGASSPF